MLCVIGYLAGLARPENGQLKSAFLPMAVVVAAAIGSTLLYAGVGALVGDTAARHVGLGSLLFTAAVYDLLLAPFTVPLIMALARRTVNDPLTESSSGRGDVAVELARRGHRTADRQPARRTARQGRPQPGRTRRTHQGSQATVRTHSSGGNPRTTGPTTTGGAP